MLRCELDLGQSPWVRLEQGKVEGLIRLNGGAAFPVRAKIRGAHSRKFPRKSLQVDLSGERLPDGPPEGHTVRRLHLNADYIDPTRMRSALSYGLFHAMGALAPLCRHTNLSVSGEEQGVYLALESVDADFCRRRSLAPGPIYYAVNRNANLALVSPTSKLLKQPLDLGYQAVAKADPAPLRRMIMDINLATDREFPAAVERWVDVNGYLLWLMVAVFVGNRDGFMHNYALYRNPDTRRFSVIPWDYDATWGMDIHGRAARLDRVPALGWNRLTERLMATAAYRRRYKSQFRMALNEGPLAPDRISAMIDNMCREIAPWVDIFTRPVDKTEPSLQGVDGLRWWARERRALLLQELAEL